MSLNVPKKMKLPKNSVPQKNWSFFSDISPTSSRIAKIRLNPVGSHLSDLSDSDSCYYLKNVT